MLYPVDTDRDTRVTGRSQLKGEAMLSALKMGQIDAFVRAVDPELTAGADAVSGIQINHEGIHLRIYDPESGTHQDDGWVLKRPADYPDPDYIRLIGMIWGGPLDDVMYIRVFRGGYEVITRTDVIDPRESLLASYAQEVRVGRVVP